MMRLGSIEDLWQWPSSWSPWWHAVQSPRAEVPDDEDGSWWGCSPRCQPYPCLTVWDGRPHYPWYCKLWPLPETLILEQSWHGEQQSDLRQHVLPLILVVHVHSGEEHTAQLLMTRKNDFINTFFIFVWFYPFFLFIYYRINDFVSENVVIMLFIWKIFLGFSNWSFEPSSAGGRAGLWHVTPQHGDSVPSCTQTLCYTNWQHIE